MPTLDEMQVALRRLGWSAGKLARRLAISPRKAHRIMTGKSRAPPGVAEWLCFLAEPLLQAPPDRAKAMARQEERPLPEGWRMPVPPTTPP